MKTIVPPTFIFVPLAIAIFLAVFFSPDKSLMLLFQILFLFLLIIKLGLQLIIIIIFTVILPIVAIPLKLLVGSKTVASLLDLQGDALTVIEGLYLWMVNSIADMVIDTGKIFGFNLPISVSSDLGENWDIILTGLQGIIVDIQTSVEEIVNKWEDIDFGPK